MTEPTRYSAPPIVLPLEPWLLEARPVPGCDVCGALDRQLQAALDAGDTRYAAECAHEIRLHPHDPEGRA
ncbi:hypothetical protein [Streptomyces boncukensis]|uniref:Uncharacterized protein n=1 Tax=Streptomyces boncukensis TaxID=2711219 RepID=A0A6G4WX04_9ACTN|nr:hypothetical protein [Streptomyces boncukensis]NGO69054.1 hypothetical protein [Streptomyces boncukensis]